MRTKRQRPHGTGTLYKREGHGSWIVRWFTHDGKRVERSTRTTDRAAAERILAKHVADAALRRDGVIDAAKDRFAVEGRKPLAEHVRDYIAHCRLAGMAPRHVSQTESRLTKFQAETAVSRLAEVTADVLGRHLATLKAAGLAPKTVNGAREKVCAFVAWCVATRRAESNPLTVVPKLDERKDRRRVRRPLTDDELARLLAVAARYGRKLWYMAAVLAGLR